MKGDLREQAVATLAKDWNHRQAAQVIDHIDRTPALKAAVVAYLTREDTSERDGLIRSIRHHLAVIRISDDPELHAIADALGPILDRLGQPELIR